jgi:hypothetical protein
MLGVCGAAIVAFVALYPNLSAMPLPSVIAPMYNGILPTWLYGFQFSVNLQQAANVPLFGTASIMWAVVALGLAGVAGYAAWVRRLVIGYRRHQQAAYADATGDFAQANGAGGDDVPAPAGDSAGAGNSNADSSNADPNP